MTEIICICFGNVCRSPIAEAMLQRALAERLGEGAVVVSSAGIAATDGYPPSQGSVRAMQTRGFDIRGHRSRELTLGWARNAFLMYCMEDYQVDRVRAMLSDGVERARLFGGQEVPDPLGSGQAAYEAVADQIESLLPQVVEEVVAELGAGERDASTVR